MRCNIHTSLTTTFRLMQRDIVVKWKKTDTGLYKSSATSWLQRLKTSERLLETLMEVQLDDHPKHTSSNKTLLLI